MSKKGSKFNRKQPLPARPAQPKPEATPLRLNLGYYNASTVTLPQAKLIQVILAGCGGIGAYMAMHIGRITRSLYNDDKGINLTLVDPDVVKEENLGRQYFCEAEIGEPKAIALARRFGHAWGIATTAYVGEYNERLLLKSDLTILVGCVDNPYARQVLAATLQHNPEEPSLDRLPKIWWLDCGNIKDTGRVLLGSAYSRRQMQGAFLDKKRCISLPSPALQYPSLLIPQREDTDAREMSCAELAAANLQSLNINPAIAVQASDFLTRMLITNDLKRYQCVVNMASGSVNSFYTTPEEVAREIERPASFVRSEIYNEAAA
jgi:PRTRC genetic system ThiF family protein